MEANSLHFLLQITTVTQLLHSRNTLIISPGTNTLLDVLVPIDSPPMAVSNTITIIDP